MLLFAVAGRRQGSPLSSPIGPDAKPVLSTSLSAVGWPAGSPSGSGAKGGPEASCHDTIAPCRLTICSRARAGASRGGQMPGGFSTNNRAENRTTARPADRRVSYRAAQRRAGGPARGMWSACTLRIPYCVFWTPPPVRSTAAVCARYGAARCGRAGYSRLAGRIASQA